MSSTPGIRGLACRLMRRCTVLSLFLVASPPPPAAASIHPAVSQQLQNLPDGQTITVVLELESQADILSADHALKRERAGRAERHRRVSDALQRAARASQPPVLEALTDLRALGQVTTVTPYWIANVIRISATREGILTLSSRADIRMVYPQERVHLIEPVRRGPRTRPSLSEGSRGEGIGIPPGLAAIQAPRVWFELGVTGQGALVGSLDTGVDGHHPALADRWRGNNGHPWQACWLDVQGGGVTYPRDPYEHGTHVMGTMTGRSDATGDTIGVAWGAQWIAANGIGNDPFDLETDIIACFEWFADPDGDLSTIDDVPDVIQNSWGVSEWQGYADCADIWNLVIDNCEAAGIVVLFSAGNNGPSPSSLDSPADRATTKFSCFSVGAVDATNYAWPFPIAEFSSRGPSPCTTMPGFLIKPEVCAPGVRVYSSIPDGQYVEQDGTSMSGPHVAGVVALMRSVNPDIEVDAIKQILMDTARDEGAPGEDNDYGWGCIDAYEAVLSCLGGGYGSCAGQVTNLDGGGSPVPFARVRLVETNNVFTADAMGWYWGLSAPGTYTMEASHPSFAPKLRFPVIIASGQQRTENFALDDIAPPEFTDVLQPPWIENPSNPIPVRVTITDFSAITSKDLIWRVSPAAWNTTPLTNVGGTRYAANIPSQPLGSIISYYLRAGDAAGNSATEPASAPNTFWTIEVLPVYFADDAESDKGWTLSLTGDAPVGRWVRQDPYGTRLIQGTWVEPPDDHTPESGVACFVTGAGAGNGEPDQSDVDDGCVNLTSPLIDLHNADRPVLSYWRWFALMGLYTDGSFEAKVSSNGGQTWTTLELLTQNASAWTRAAFDLQSRLALTQQMRLRFTVCDTAEPSLVEGLLDDLVITSTSTTSGVDASSPSLSLLEPMWPNPFTRSVQIRLRLPHAGEATLTVYDPTGRRVRELLSGPLDQGQQVVSWDGRDDDGSRVAAGLYFCALRGRGFAAQQKVLLLK